MLDNRTGRVVGKRPDSIISGSRVGPPDETTSPKSPLEFRILSPRCLKNWDIGGIGLGFVAALENFGSDIPVMGGLNVIRSAKISTKCKGDSANCGGGLGCWESCTSVTSHGPNKSFTRVYFDGNAGCDRRDFNKKLSNLGESSARFIKANRNFPISDFLSSCYKCGKLLHGRDIYMYRGDKAFCSVECRSTQIVIDEQHKNKCGSDVSRSAEVSGSSPYSRDQLFSIDIIVS